MRYGNDLSEFSEWNNELDRLLVAGNQSKRASDVLLDARIKAFKQGVAPTDFVAQPNIPFRVWSDKGVRTARIILWSIAGAGMTLVVFGLLLHAAQPLDQNEAEAQTSVAPQSTAPQVPTQPVINFEVTAERLAKSYDENAVAANQTFKGNWVAVTGTVIDVKDDPPTIRMSGDGRTDFSRLFVFCEFEDHRRDEVAKVRVGSRITVFGKVDGNAYISGPSLIKCQLEL